MGFQSADAIITKGVKHKFETSGVYTLLASTFVYYLILRLLLVDLFSTGNYIIYYKY